MKQFFLFLQLDFQNQLKNGVHFKGTSKIEKKLQMYKWRSIIGKRNGEEEKDRL